MISDYEGKDESDIKLEANELLLQSRGFVIFTYDQALNTHTLAYLSDKPMVLDGFIDHCVRDINSLSDGHDKIREGIDEDESS